MDNTGQLKIVLNPVGTEQQESEIVFELDAVQASSASLEEVGAFLTSRIMRARFGAPERYVAGRRRALTKILDREIEIVKYAASPFAEEVMKHGHAGRDVIVIGKSASGKTVSGNQAALGLARQGTAVIWLDLSEPDRDVWDVLGAILRSRSDQPLCVFVDDAQANPRELSQLAAAQNIFSPFPLLRFQATVIAWSSYRDSISPLWPAAVLIYVHPERVLHQMTLSGLSGSFSYLDRQQLEHMANGDLVVARFAMSFMNREMRFPKGDELAVEALSGLVGNITLDRFHAEILHRAAALSQFEIDASLAYLEQISRHHVEKLISSRCLRRNGMYLSIGHRSTSRLLLRGLSLRFPEFTEKLPAPSKLAIDYLRTADTRQLVTTLERLDIARLQRSLHDQHGTKFLVRLWTTLRMLLTALAEAGAKDPSWHDDTGSASCASRVLSEFNYDCAKAIVEFQRNRWSISQTNDLVPGLPPPNERKDFDEIRRCMKEEESSGPIPSYAETSDRLDFDRMHRNWALGLLLGLEAAATNYSAIRLNSLKLIAEKTILANGSFYPARVPWVTARILIGLSQTGESVETSEVVRKACQWLLQEAPEGPGNFGAWHPHTGVWNTTIGTTAMCVNALLRCGIRADHPSMDLAINYLLDARSEWARPGQEIDCAFALDTFLLSGALWRDFASELTRLLEWANDPHIWTNVVLDASQAKDESLKIPLIAASMVGIIWSIVKSELPLLLEDLATGTFLPDAMLPSDYKQELQGIVRQLEEIKSHIRSHIEQRLMLLADQENVGLHSVRRKLKDFRELSIRCDEATDAAKRLTAQSSTEVLAPGVERLRANVNSLGVDVFGEGWKDVRDEG